MYKGNFWFILKHSPFICLKTSRRSQGSTFKIHQLWLQLGTCIKLTI